MVINSASRVPKHVQAALLLKRRIKKGTYQAGTNFPPVRTLGAELGVSLNVIQRAVQLLEKEGVVETQHGIGIRVLSPEKTRRTPLSFGMVIPYSPDTRFAGTIHCFADQALDVSQNHCIVKSSSHEPARERRLVEEFIETGVEGLIVWPCEGEHNVEFFNKVSETTPLVFVDRKLEGVLAPSVVLDFDAAGRDMVMHLGSQGFRKVLILEDPLPISSYRELYAAMKDAVREIDGRGRFDFEEVETTRFTDLYPVDPERQVTEHAERLARLLDGRGYEAVFATQAEYLDYVFVGTDLRTQYPNLKLSTISNTLPSPRSLAYYQRGVREWIGDFGLVIGKAAEILHDMVYLRSRPTRQYRVKFTTMVRSARSK